VRILHYICPFFPRPYGATYSAYRLARGLRERGTDAIFFVEDFGPDWREGGTHDGFPVRSFTLQQPGKIKKLRGLLTFTRQLLANKNNFDLFHAHGGGYINLFLTLWVRLLTRKPTLLKITSDGWDTPEGMAAEKWGGISLFAYRRLTGIVAMTSGQAEKCRAWKIPAQVTVIPNGVDCTRYQPATGEEKNSIRDQLGIPHDAFVLTFTGWLGHGKGTDVLVEIWKQLHAQDDKVFLLLVGDYLSARGMGAEGSDAVPQSPAIRLVGHVDDAERYMKASDLFVFPSRKEGFGTVQIEAMACGLPCVVNDLPGVSSDIFPDEACGFRISGNSVENFVEKVSRLKVDTSLRAKMSAAARARAVEHFSIESVAARYDAFYQQLVKKT
jgi:glycosyltransferase involved in cell wall biosynthesis